VQPGMQQPPGGLPFAHQRIVFLTMLLSAMMYIVVIAALQQVGGIRPFEKPLPVFDTIVPVLAATIATGALLLRSVQRQTAEALAGAERQAARFRATLVPLAMVEAGCLFAATAWWLNGTAVPHLVAALVLLSIAIAIVPFQDPDAGR
jgi:hypothetical protein